MPLSNNHILIFSNIYKVAEAESEEITSALISVHLTPRRGTMCKTILNPWWPLFATSGKPCWHRWLAEENWECLKATIAGIIFSTMKLFLPELKEGPLWAHLESPKDISFLKIYTSVQTDTHKTYPQDLQENIPSWSLEVSQVSRLL